MKKTTQFRRLLLSDQLEFLCEAHNGISAIIAEEAGFQGIWGSGLSLSAQFGVRDNNEASWTQVLEMLEFMSDATRVPILLDGDTGYGNFNNMRRLVSKLEQRGIAAVCIEDKLFPKTNSFIGGETQALADINEFCGKIKAGKDAQTDDDFSIIARVEAFIAGWGLTEALKRAEAYHAAGADGILIHSALAVPDEILAFKREWGERCPVVIVPTKYYATPTEVFRDYGFSVVIWANHLMRASIAAMQETARTLMTEANLLSVEDRLVPVSEVFRLQGAEELQSAEKRYLPRSAQGVRAIVLAASQGVAQTVADMVRCHHERFDGSGYPQGMYGNQIPPFGRIAGIADSYDAMTSETTYSRPMAAYDAARVLNDTRGEEFAAEVVEQFLATMGMFPVASLVELNDGSVAVVLEQNPNNVLRPKILLLLDQNRTPLPQPRVVEMRDLPLDATQSGALWIVSGHEHGAFGIDPADIFK